MLKEISITTHSNTQLINITQQIQTLINNLGFDNGICTLFVPHTTAAITINESADPSVKEDILKTINKVIPFNDNYKHFEGNSAAHIKSSLFGFSETIIFQNKNLLLGTWQGIYFCEFDGPRNRKLFVKIISGN